MTRPMAQLRPARPSWLGPLWVVCLLASTMFTLLASSGVTAAYGVVVTGVLLAVGWWSFR